MKSGVTIHGQANRGKKTPEYSIWCTMIARCNNPKSQRYNYYGAKGVKVCNRWLVFANFFADMGVRPSNKHSIDRYPNSKGNYEPGNCRWATPEEQQNNKSNSIWIIWEGQRKTLAQWAQYWKIPYSQFYWLFKRRHLTKTSDV